MEYVEILRARRVLRIYAVVLLVGLVLAALSLFSFGGHLSGHVNVRIEGGRPTLTVSAILVAAATAAFTIATNAALGLGAESSTLAITWTRPVPRSTIAWRFIAIDLATILVSYAALFVVILIGLAMFGLLGSLNLDGPEAAATLASGLGCAVMFYALVMLLTVLLPGRGGAIAWLSWAAFLVLGGLWAAPFPTLIHWLIVALNYLNPLAYFGNIGSSGTDSILPLSRGVRTLLAWCMGFAALVAAVRLWSTREV